MITNTTVTLLPDDLHPPARVVTSETGQTFLNLLPTLTLAGGREQLADLLRAGLTALYGGHPSVMAEVDLTTTVTPPPNGRWAFGPMGMVKVGGDDDDE